MANAAPAAREPEAIDVVSRLSSPCCFWGGGTTVRLLRGKTTWRWNRGAPWLAALSATMLLGPRQEPLSPTPSFGANLACAPFRLLRLGDGGYAGTWPCLHTTATNTYRTPSTTNTWKMTTTMQIACPFVPREFGCSLCRWLQTLTDCECRTGGASLASNVTRYRYENGRRYHSYSKFTSGFARLWVEAHRRLKSVLTSRLGDGTYYAPNDEKYSNYETIV